VAKAVNNNSKPEKGARSASDKGKSRAKAPAKQGRSARARAAQSRPGAKGEKRGVGKFMRDVRVEMGKVTWPTRQDLLQSTIVVLVAVAIAAAFTAVCDLAFSQFVEQVLNLIS
jgi:preprotein translocase subunit SecE